MNDIKMIVMDLDGTLLTKNQKYFTLYKRCIDEISGKRYLTCFSQWKRY